MTTASALLICSLLAAEPFELRAYNEQRLAANRVAMTVLAGWAGANLLSGTGALISKDPQLRSFFLGNAAWNLVNALLAGFALADNLRTDPAALSFNRSLQDGQGLEKTYLFNAGLDVAYLAGSALLWTLGRSHDEPRLVGFGQSLLLQGSFGLLLDATMFFVLQALNRPILERASQPP